MDMPEHSGELENGAQLLEDIRSLLKRFVWLPEPRYYDLLSVWVLYTHAYDRFDHAPRLAIWSPTKGSGKSTRLSVLKHLVRKGKIRVSPTPAGLFRGMHSEHPTLLIDELDKHVTQQGRLDRLLHEVMNAGHMRGAEVDRFNLDKDAMGTFDPFGPMAFAFKAVKLPDDLMDRSLLVKLKPARGKGYTLFNTRRHGDELKALEVRARAWVEQSRDVLDAADPAIPSDIVDRRRSNWRPLFAIADAAGAEWPKRVADAARVIEGQREQEGELRVLIDMDAVWPSGKDFLPTEQLVSAVNEREEWTWGAWNSGQGLNGHALAALLRPFDVRPKQHRLDGEPVRGYWRGDLDNALHEYGLAPEIKPALAA